MLLLPVLGWSQQKYWIFFRDKGLSEKHRIDATKNENGFLAKKALDRRLKVMSEHDLIDDADFRGRMQRRMKIADLDSTVLSLEHVPAFARAIDYILDNHDSLKEESARNPITVT